MIAWVLKKLAELLAPRCPECYGRAVTNGFEHEPYCEYAEVTGA